MAYGVVDVAIELDLSPGRVRQLTEWALPAPLPCVRIGRRREFNPVAVAAWEKERRAFFGGDPRKHRDGHGFAEYLRLDRKTRLRRRLATKYGGKLGVTEALLDRWAARGWR